MGRINQDEQYIRTNYFKEITSDMYSTFFQSLYRLDESMPITPLRKVGNSKKKAARKAQKKARKINRNGK